MRIVTSAFLAALLVIQTACSPAADPESSPAEEPAPEETEAAEAGDEPSDPGEDESAADGGSEDLNGLDDLEDLGDVEVDRNILSVDITIPASFFEGEDPQDIIDAAGEQGIQETTVNPDGSVTYRMSRGQHRELLEELRTSIAQSLNEIVSEFASVQAIDHNNDFTEIEMRVDREAYENSLDSFAIFGIAIGAGYYQLFSGADADSYRVVVNTIDADTNEAFDTFILPDDWE